MQPGDQSGRVKTALWHGRLGVIGLPSRIGLHQRLDLLKLNGINNCPDIYGFIERVADA